MAAAEVEERPRRGDQHGRRERPPVIRLEVEVDALREEGRVAELRHAERHDEGLGVAVDALLLEEGVDALSHVARVLVDDVAREKGDEPARRVAVSARAARRASVVPDAGANLTALSNVENDAR